MSPPGLPGPLPLSTHHRDFRSCSFTQRGTGTGEAQHRGEESARHRQGVLDSSSAFYVPGFRSLASVKGTAGSPFGAHPSAQEEPGEEAGIRMALCRQPQLREDLCGYQSSFTEDTYFAIEKTRTRPLAGSDLAILKQ